MVPSLKEVNMVKEEFWPKDGSLPSLSSLISPHSWMLFHYLDLQKADLPWLKVEPSTWKYSISYNKFKSFVCGQQVVNDPAERGVKLVQDFINSSYNAEERQNILIAVSESRKRKGGKCTKKELKN